MCTTRVRKALKRRKISAALVQKSERWCGKRGTCREGPGSREGFGVSLHMAAETWGYPYPWAFCMNIKGKELREGQTA